MNLRNLAALVITAIIPCCAPSVDLDRKPDRKVTVINAKTKDPVPQCNLVYVEYRQFLFDHYFYFSRPYTTDENGEAYVPSGRNMTPTQESGYYRHAAGNNGFQPNAKIIYVLPIAERKPIIPKNRQKSP